MNPSIFDIPADLDTPVSAFMKLRPLGARFLLESAERGRQLARYSFIGFGEMSDIRFNGRRFDINGEALATPRNGLDLLNGLRAALACAPRLGDPATALPFAGGLVGAASYDLARWFEPGGESIAAAGLLGRAPVFHYLVPGALLVFDHLTRTAGIFCANAERTTLRGSVVAALAGPISACVPRGRVGHVQESLPRADFLERVARIKAHIAAGDIYQLVLSNRFEGEGEVDAFEAYRVLRRLNPSAYMFFLDLGERKLVGASPEALVKLANGQASLRPIAGTRPRGRDTGEDDRLQTQLLEDPKERAEHVMLVDLARNDLGRVCRPGTIDVAPFMNVEHYSHVMHLVSGVSGTLAQGQDGFDLFRAVFPAGTLTGAPKVRAMHLISELEPVSRGFYGGAVGYFSNGAKGPSLDQAIAIRMLEFTPGHYAYQAGAGIVADSDPNREYEEVLHKSAVMRQVLAELGGP